jgi:hypothetical protein
MTTKEELAVASLLDSSRQLVDFVERMPVKDAVVIDLIRYVRKSQKLAREACRP